MRERGRIGADDEERAADGGHDQDRAPDRAPRVDGFLGKRCEGVEAEKRQRGERRARQGRRQRHVGLEERFDGHQPAGTGAEPHIADGKRDEGRDHQHLERDQDDVDPVGEHQADDVDGGGAAADDDDPDPDRNAGDGRRQKHRGDQPGRHRQKQIVQHRRPADQKADRVADRAADIGVGRAGDRIDRHHAPIAERGERDGAERQQIGAGRRAARQLVEFAIDREHAHRRDIGKTEQHHAAEPQRPPKFMLAGRAGVVGHGSLRHGDDHARADAVDDQP